MSDLTNKTVFITAAGQGIGHASARAFVEAGANVIATDVNEEGLQSLSGCKTLKLDVLDDSAVAEVMGSVGPVDVLFNCAGIVHSGSVLQATDKEFDFAYDLNVKAMVRLIRAVLPGMLERKDGSIINMSSVLSSMTGAPNRCVYGTTKAAVLGLTMSIAAEYVSQGIRCNAICPGTVQSPSLEGRLAETGDYEAARKAFIARQPMGRIGKAEEIADLAVYIAGATYTTGQAFAIDGGWTI
ncbi:MAG: SDR family oxidoreductase [Pseudomonadota bacterium]